MLFASPHPLNAAHRGARSLAPENTLAAARQALALGADLWELDVACTADGQLVVLHDDTLERTSDAPVLYPDRAPWPVAAFTLAELRRLDFGSWFVERDPFDQLAAGAVSASLADSYCGERIPTLAEALDFTRSAGWRVNVELKDLSDTPGDRQAPEQAARLILSLGLASQVIVSSFNYTYLQRVRAVSPALALGALVERAAPLPPPVDAFAGAALLRRLDAQAFHPELGLLAPAALRALRDLGYDVLVWTVNDPGEMRAVLAAGASGLITDFPQRLTRLLRHPWKGPGAI